MPWSFDSILHRPNTEGVGDGTAANFLWYKHGVYLCYRLDSE